MESKKEAIIGVLNRIVELELSGAIRYTQYSLMVFGHSRIPIIGWMREQAAEGLLHASEAGEEITTLGGRVSLRVAETADTYHESLDDILRELIAHESKGIELYRELLDLNAGVSVSMEEFARDKIRSEELHVAAIEKMLGDRRKRA